MISYSPTTSGTNMTQIEIAIDLIKRKGDCIKAHSIDCSKCPLRTRGGSGCKGHVGKNEIAKQAKEYIREQL